MNTSTTWSGQDPTLSSASHDDFQQFLDMGMPNLADGLSFDFPDFGTQENGNAQMMHHDGAEVMDTTGMEGDMGLLAHKDALMRGQMLPVSRGSGHSTIAGTPVEQPQDNSLVELDAQIQYLQQQRLHQQQRQLQEQQRNFYAQHQNLVPPTPNSNEMRGNTQFFSQSDSQQSAMYERFHLQLKEQEMTFTPLVSPAVTPLEAHFSMSEYTVPGAYFSPLSSPALHAQNEHRSVYDTRHVDTSSTPSPNDMTVDSISAPTSTGPSAKKSTKKTALKLKNPRTSTRGVRQSPISKPLRRSTGSVQISRQALSELSEPAIPLNSSSISAPSTEDSNDSVSPEHLSDMAPPPLPGSANRSPFLASQNGQGGSNGHDEPNAQSRAQPISNGLSPATPASLMRITKTSSPSLNDLGDPYDHAMDGFSLPEAAHAPRPSLSRIETRSDGQTTPTLDSASRTPAFVPLLSPAGQTTPTLDSASRTPAFAPLPSPAFVRPTTAASGASPQISSMNGNSNSNSNGLSASRKTPQPGPRGSKKRSSVSSVHVSPALRPKISPSIKPLIRGSSSVTDDTASLLLASKSNYQNILEGTHLPGVNYPTELSTNLTSKRTSHKIAEQGRRNRINSALQEIATLLPKDGPSSGNERSGSGEGGKDNVDEGGGKGAAQSANSKASTVELAIEYIKQLKKEVEDANRRAEECERKLREKLEEGS